MKGDFTRSTFRAAKHYRAVLMQQGRVQLDADWNEQIGIEAYRADSHAVDVIGSAGGSFSAGGFAVAADELGLPASQRDAAAPLLPLKPGDFVIAAGRYYVGGLACDSERPVSYSQQPDLPNPDPAATGRHLVYLDAWEQHVTAIEDPSIRETALGGPDTATRVRLVWQIRILALPGNDDPGREARAAFESLTAKPSGRLTARAQPVAASSEPCAISPGAGYRSLENQLYRIEIHTPARKPGGSAGSLGHATFKWSRDNGSIVTAWLDQSGTELSIESNGRDGSLAFQVGDWVELTDDERELRGEPGVLVKLTAVSSQTLTIAASDGIRHADFPRNPKVRRWNTASATGDQLVEVSAANDGYLEIEDGVQVKFADGVFSTGDYWLIPARSALGTVEWPKPPDDLLAPSGPAHHYAPLAVIEYDGAAVTVVADLRSRFPATTELTSLFAVGGDGQQASPGQTLPQPIAVGVASGQWPVERATIRFTVTSGGGSLDESVSTRDVLTDATGIATCRWTVGTEFAAQEVTATLLDSSGTPIHLPVRFHATLGTTSIDAAVRITAITLEDGTPVNNDAEIPSHRVAEGLRVRCDDKVAAASIARPTAALTIELPWPLTTSDQALWGNRAVGFQPVTLNGRTTISGNAIEWAPRGPARGWLESSLFEALRTAGQTEPVLARLRLDGNFIWSAADASILLDGEAFGRPAAATTPGGIALALPSGDGRRGGVFDMWFWLVDVTVTVTLDNDVVQAGARVGFTVGVTGTDNQAVTVHANRGTIQAGATEGAYIYTAPSSLELPGGILGQERGSPPRTDDTPNDPTRPDDIDLPGGLSIAVITVTSVVDPTRPAEATIRILGGRSPGVGDR